MAIALVNFSGLTEIHIRRPYVGANSICPHYPILGGLRGGFPLRCGLRVGSLHGLVFDKLMSVDHSRDVAYNVPTKFWLWRCS